MTVLSVNTNTLALNSSRNLGRHYAGLSTSIRRLSSGLRVDTSADDAAGLAIRELMRADIAALNQGVRNINDAISLIQTADGALQIVDEKLIRMKELAEQAATGTYDSTQRLMLDAEYQQMAREMNRIGRATTFNGIRLLNGNLEAAHDGSGLSSRSGPPGSLDGIMFGGMLKIHFGSGNDSAEDYMYLQIFDTTNMFLNLGDEYSIEDMATAEYTRPFLLGIETLLKPRVVTDPCDLPLTQEDIDAGMITKEEYQTVLEAVKASADAFMKDSAHGFDDDGRFEAAFKETFGESIVPRDTSFVGPEGLTYAYLDGMDTEDYSAMRAAYTALTGDEKEKYHLAFLRNSIQNMGERVRNGLIFTDPDNNPGGVDFFAAVDEDLRDEITRAGVGAAGQFHDLHTYAGRNIRTQHHAQIALEAVDRAMIKKDNNRAHLGAMQKKLENTASALQIQAENLHAAESRISDVDVSKEMSNFVRNQILTQSAVAMLSQANSMPQTLLSLIQR